MYSNSGFDMLDILSKVRNRPCPKIDLGPVDMSSSFLVVDARRYDLPIVYCSESFERLTGYAADEIVGLNCRFLQSPDGIVERGAERKYVDNTIVYQLKRSIDDHQECQFVNINYKKGGEPFVNLITVIPILEEEYAGDEGMREVKYFVGFQVDLMVQSKAILGRLEDGNFSMDSNLSIDAPLTSNNPLATPTTQLNQSKTDLKQPASFTIPSTNSFLPSFQSQPAALSATQDLFTFMASNPSTVIDLASSNELLFGSALGRGHTVSSSSSDSTAWGKPSSSPHTDNHPGMTDSPSPTATSKCFTPTPPPPSDEMMFLPLDDLDFTITSAPNMSASGPMRSASTMSAMDAPSLDQTGLELGLFQDAPSDLFFGVLSPPGSCGDSYAGQAKSDEGRGGLKLTLPLREESWMMEVSPVSPNEGAFGSVREADDDEDSEESEESEEEEVTSLRKKMKTDTSERRSSKSSSSAASIASTSSNASSQNGNYGMKRQQLPTSSTGPIGISLSEISTSVAPSPNRQSSFSSSTRKQSLPKPVSEAASSWGAINVNPHPISGTVIVNELVFPSPSAPLPDHTQTDPTRPPRHLVELRCPNADGDPDLLSHYNLVQNSPDCVHILSSRGIVLYASPHASKKILEFEAGELIGRNVSRFCHPGDLISLMRELKGAAVGGRIECAYRFRRRWSGYVWIEVVGHKYEMRNRKRTKCFVLSARERVGGGLICRDLVGGGSTKASGDWKAALWAKMSPQGLVLFVSPNSVPVFGISPDEMYAKSILDLVHPSDKQALRDSLAAATKAMSESFTSPTSASPLRSPKTIEVTLSGTSIKARIAIFPGSSGHLITTPDASSLPGRFLFLRVEVEKRLVERFGGVDVTSLDPGTDLLGIVGVGRHSSLQFEVNQLRIENRRILAELEGVGAALPLAVGGRKRGYNEL
ncbi:blue light receptor [Dinochytrium kinnereticum]|nr:blue light receptor [Dinochytrium kinnereticum]